MPHDVIMPALGMSQDTALLISWLKQPGDAISAGDALMEVETDKAVMEVEAQTDGFLTNVVAAAGDHVPVGQVVAVIAETADGGDSADANDAAMEESPTSGADNPEESLPPGQEIIMPALGMAQDTGLIVAWCKNTGDPVAADDILLEVETDKSVMEVEAGYDGYVAAVLADAQQAVPVGSVIAIISTDKPDKLVSRRHVAGAKAKPANSLKPEAQASGNDNVDVVDSQPEARVSSTTAPSGWILASPKARRLALEQGLELERLVELGVPQPYHVADLNRFKDLDQDAALPHSTAKVSAARTPAVMQITARVPTVGCDEFIGWMAHEVNLDLPACLVWLRFATAAFRQAVAEDTDKLIVEIRQLRGTNGRFADPDKSRLSQSIAEHSDLSPDLLVRDFTDSPISSASASIGSAAVLTIGQTRRLCDFVRL